MAQILVKLDKEDMIKIIAEKYEVGISNVDILPYVEYKTEDGREIWNVVGYVDVTQE